ncbi:MAG: PLP-dependent aminotransferase family protein [Candidatus Heimdallarchaeota archaeon]
MVSHLQPSRKYTLAAWTEMIPESEIRRLLAFKVRFFFGGGKPGALPTGIFSMILEELSQRYRLPPDGAKSALADLNYGPTGGEPWFRQTLATRLRERDQLSLDADEGWQDVVITNGSQQCLYTLLDSIINPGDIILTARPAYLGFLVPVVKLGGEIVTVRTDLEGIIPECVEAAIRACQRELHKTPELLYVVADSDNPKGTTLPEKRRKQLYDLAETYNIIILEDAAYKEIQFQERVPPIKRLDTENERVCYLSTTSKEAAVLRVGYSVLPPKLRDEVIKDKGYIDACSSTLIQRILDIYYRAYIDQALSETVAVYKKRRDAMCSAMDESFPAGVRTDPHGGFFVWWESEKPFDATVFLEQVAIPNDILYVPGKAFYPLKGCAFHMTTDKLGENIVHTNSMRLSYSYMEPEKITTGIYHLGELLTKELS